MAELNPPSLDAHKQPKPRHPLSKTQHPFGGITHGLNRRESIVPTMKLLSITGRKLSPSSFNEKFTVLKNQSLPYLPRGNSAGQVKKYRAKTTCISVPHIPPGNNFPMPSPEGDDPRQKKTRKQSAFTPPPGSMAGWFGV